MANNSRAFYRAMQMRNAILAIVSSTASPLLAQIAIGKLGAYKSRGHGGRHYPKLRFGTLASVYRACRSGHIPHQGKKEIARRAARGIDGQCGVLHG